MCWRARDWWYLGFRTSAEGLRIGKSGDGEELTTSWDGNTCWSDACCLVGEGDMIEKFGDYWTESGWISC